MGVEVLGRPGLKSLREYSIDTLVELGKTLPVLKCDVNKFTGDAWRARLIRPPRGLDGDIVFPADFPKMSRRKRSEVHDYRLHHAEPGTRGQQGPRKKIPPRLGSPATAALSIKIPPPYSSDRETGFEEFLETVPSPTNKRVTAGGRVVPAAPGSVSPVAASKKAISSPVLRALQEASPLFVQSAPGGTPVVYQPIGSVHGYDSQQYGGSLEQDPQGLGYVPILGEAEAWQRAFPHSVSRANCPFAPAPGSPLGDITNAGAAAPTNHWPAPYRTFEEQGPYLSEQQRGATAETADEGANLMAWDGPKRPPPSTLELLQNAQMATLERARFLEMQSEMARLRRVKETTPTGSANCLEAQKWPWARSNLVSDGRVFMSSLPVGPACPQMSQPGWLFAGAVGFAGAYPPSNVHPYQLYSGQIHPRSAMPGGPYAASHPQFEYAAANQYPLGMYDGANDVNPLQGTATEYASKTYSFAGTPYIFGFDGSVEGFYSADEGASVISNGSQEARCPATYLASWGFAPPERVQPSTKVQKVREGQGSHVFPQQNDDRFDGLCDDDLVGVASSSETHSLNAKQSSSESEHGALHEMSMADEAVVIESTSESKRQHGNTPETEPDQLILGKDELARNIYRPQRETRTRKDKPAPKTSKFVSDLIDVGISATGSMSRSAVSSGDPTHAEIKLRQIQAKDGEKCGDGLHADEDEKQSTREPSPKRQSESFLQEMLKNPRYSNKVSTGSSEETDKVAKGDEPAGRSASDAGSTSDRQEAPPSPVDAGAERNSPSKGDGAGSNASGGTGPYATARSKKTSASAGSTQLYPIAPESSTNNSDRSGLSRASHYREVMEFFDRLRREEDEEIARYRREHPF